MKTPPSKKRRRIRRALLVSVLLGIVLASFSDTVAFVWPERLAYLSGRYLGRHLERQNDIAFYMSFDEPVPVEWIKSSEVHAPGTFSVPGKIGNARRFSGRSSAYIETAASWQSLGDAFTLSIWVKPEKTVRNQDIWFSALGGRETGFRLVGDTLCFSVSGGTVPQTASYEFDKYGEFVHLAATVDAAAKEARLYENGVLKDRIAIEAVALPHHNIEFGKFRWYYAFEPFCGDMDEAVAWRRALSENEIVALSRTERSLIARNASVLYGIHRLLCNTRDGIRSTFRLLDNFNLFIESTDIFSHDIPEIDLQLSKKDERHFAHEHAASLASGTLSKGGDNRRGISVRADGKTSRAQLSLDGIGNDYPQTLRASYILETTDEHRIFDETKLRLLAPESLGNDFRFAARGNGRFFKLLVNGQPKGIYYAEAFNGFGEHPQRNSIVVNKDFDDPSLSRYSADDWVVLFRDDIRDQTRSQFFMPDDVLQKSLIETAYFLAADVYHPWSVREWKWRIKNVVANNDARPPETVRPENEASQLATLFCWFTETPLKMRRTELSMKFVPPGKDPTPQWFSGVKKDRNGIKFRGNTSFWRGHKMPLSLEFDEPHFILDDSATRRISLISGYKDATRLKNKLAYDLFRAFADAPGRKRYAPVMDWCEVFVNGTYAGVYEMCTPVSIEMFDFDEDLAIDDTPILFSDALFRERDQMIICQEFPNPREADFTDELWEFRRFTDSATRTEFAEKIGEKLDLDNLRDFILLLNFTGNIDGRRSNYFIARMSKDAPFFFIPWDYDNTFSDSLIWADNGLIKRVCDEVPGFADSLAARWHELRGGVMSEDALMRRIDDMAARVRHAMQWEHRLFPDYVPADYDAEAEKLKAVVKLRLAYLDERLGAK